MGETAPPVLATKGVTKRFGDFVAVDNVDFAIAQDETLGIIGPNGAGKTTFLNLLTGFYPPESGAVFHQGEDITFHSAEKRVAMGIVRTFQLVRVFDNLPVYENLALAAYRRQEGQSVPLGMFWSRLDQARIRERVQDVLQMFELDPLGEEMTGNLSLGSKRRMEIAMAVVADPKVLLLDEPFAGLSDLEIDEVIRVFKKYSHRKTILIIEHKVSKLTELVERLAVMHEGRIVAGGPPLETLEHPEVRRVYWKIH